MKKFLIGLLTVCLVFTMFTVPVTVSASASSNMEKVLYYYHKKNYKKANTYNKKLAKYATESCVTKMPSKMKKAYKKVLKGYRLTSNDMSKRVLEAVYFSDIDNDGKAEMFVQYASCKQDRILRVYKYKNGKAVYVAHVGVGNHEFYAYPGHKGILVMGAEHYGEFIDKLTLKGTKLHTTNIGSRYLGNGNYFQLRQKLRDYYNSFVTR